LTLTGRKIRREYRYPQGFFNAFKVNFNPAHRGTKTIRAFFEKLAAGLTLKICVKMRRCWTRKTKLKPLWLFFCKTSSLSITSKWTIGRPWHSYLSLFPITWRHALNFCFERLVFKRKLAFTFAKIAL